MAKQIFSNNASSLLAASISDSDVTIQVAAGFGTFYPSPGADEYALVTLENDSGDIEIVKYTQRTGDLLQNCTRGQEGTSAQSWTAGQTRVELRLTKGTMEVFLQRGGDEMSGDLDMNGNDVIDAVLSGSGTKITAGQIVGVPIRGAEDDSSNEINVPDDGTRATAGGARILCQGDDLQSNVFTTGMIMLWYGSSASVPTGWAICDGSNGTPDMRDRFAIGAGDSYALGANGGATTVSGTTSSNGSHTHTGSTAGHALTVNELPAHTHRVRGVTGRVDHDSAWSCWDLDAGDGGEGANKYRLHGPGGGQIIENTGGGAAHSHAMNLDSNGSHTHTVSMSILPPYRALYYIMRL